MRIHLPEFSPFGTDPVPNAIKPGETRRCLGRGDDVVDSHYVLHSWETHFNKLGAHCFEIPNGSLYALTHFSLEAIAKAFGRHANTQAFY
jgi:hypothetical protein